MKRGTLSLVVGLVVVVAIAVGCARQPQHGHSPAPAAAASPSVSTTSATFSFVYTDATSVQFLSWTETSAGALTGMADELQDLGPGSPNFITSDLGWTGTLQGQHITISIPGASVSLTLFGTTLLRQEIDPQTGQITNERWVDGTVEDYDTLAQDFRTYVALEQDLTGIEFELQAGENFAGPALASQVARYLGDAQLQLATLQTQPLPYLPGLVTPWVVPFQQITSTIAAAQRFLATPTPG